MKFDVISIAEGPEAPEDPEIFDFTAPEDVLIEVIMHDPNGSVTDWKNFGIEACAVIAGKEGVTGAASYEISYNGLFDYTVQRMIEPPGEGWFVVTGITGVYTRGDGWTTDDDMDFYYEAVRPATENEIKLA